MKYILYCYHPHEDWFVPIGIYPDAETADKARMMAVGKVWCEYPAEIEELGVWTCEEFAGATIPLKQGA